MKIAVGSDERTTLTQAVLERLHEGGHQITRYGPLTKTEEPWSKITGVWAKLWRKLKRKRGFSSARQARV